MGNVLFLQCIFLQKSLQASWWRRSIQLKPQGSVHILMHRASKLLPPIVVGWANTYRTVLEGKKKGRWFATLVQQAETSIDSKPIGHQFAYNIRDFLTMSIGKMSCFIEWPPASNLSQQSAALRFAPFAQPGQARRPTDAGPHCPHPRNALSQNPPNSALQAFLHLHGKNSLHSARRSASLHRSSMKRPAPPPEGAERRITNQAASWQKAKRPDRSTDKAPIKTHLRDYCPA